MEQVRDLFSEDLKRFHKPPICLLPEWICFVITEAALKHSEEVIFYPVAHYECSVTPLQINWEELTKIAENYLDRPLVILLAQPLGYIDPGMDAFVEKHKNRDNIHLYLDLAQSYGQYDFEHLLPSIEHIYLSFNGNKLLNRGGAVRIKNKMSDELKREIFEALAIQKTDWLQTREEITKHLSVDWLVGMTRKYDLPLMRSNLHRTAIPLSPEDPAFSLLEKEGFGQSVHPDPQHQYYQPSKAYQSWMKNIFLFFSKRRSCET